MSTVHEGGSASILGSLSAQGSLRSRVTGVLREAMVAGELEPGQINSAPVLAQKLGVSPTPVREAMMELARELRDMIEVPAVGRVAEAGHGVQGLKPLADELDLTAAEGELQAFIAADMAFHLQLLGLLGNPVLVDEVRRLRGMSRLYGLRRLHQEEEGALAATAHEHHELLDLVEAGDRAGAEALMRKHLGHVRGIWAGCEES